MGSLFDNIAETGRKFNLQPHLPSIHHRTPVKIGYHQRFVLTPVGKQKANSFGASGIKFEVLCHLAEEGSVSVAELEAELNIPVNKGKAIMKVLVQSQYIRAASEGGME